MGDGYHFEDEDNLGIFIDPEVASNGDPALGEDIALEGYVETVRFATIEGDDIPVPVVEEVGVLDAPSPVHERNFICLAGPCRHYTETAVLKMSGPAVDAEEPIEMERWCGRLRTWAEQTSLKDVDVFGCSCYEPDQSADLDKVRAAILQSARHIANMRLRAKEVGTRYGVCAVGPCEDFIEIIIRKPKDEATTRKSMRYCIRLQGLGRLHQLAEEPVIACSAWRPRSRSEQVGAVAASNWARLEGYRRVFAERPEKNGTSDGSHEPEADHTPSGSDADGGS
jgi:hypothetical protein